MTHFWFNRAKWSTESQISFHKNEYNLPSQYLDKVELSSKWKLLLTKHDKEYKIIYKCKSVQTRTAESWKLLNMDYMNVHEGSLYYPAYFCLKCSITRFFSVCTLKKQCTNLQQLPLHNLWSHLYFSILISHLFLSPILQIYLSISCSSFIL